MSDIIISDDEINDYSMKNNIRPFEPLKHLSVKMSEVKATIQPWFWPGMIPDQSITLFGGIGGIGKSLLLLYLAAKTTTGEEFSAGGMTHKLPKGSVLLLSAEDDCESQIKPKLLACNANNEKIYYMKSKIGTISGKKKFLELDKDIHMLEEEINSIGDVRLIIIDPISYFTGDTRDHVGSEVANFLSNLIDLAKKYNLAVILNKHLRKLASGGKSAVSATSEVGGSGAWTNTPRKCWLITNHHEDNNIKIITQMKDNLSKSNSESLAYQIKNTTVHEGSLSIETTYLAWMDQKINMTADEAIDKNAYLMDKQEEAIEQIVDYLTKNGQAVVKNIAQFVLQKGIKERTFRRACEEFERLYSGRLKITRGVKNAKIYQLLNDDQTEW